MTRAKENDGVGTVKHEPQVRLRLASRASPLALSQSRIVAAAIHQLTGRSCEIVKITTMADRLLDAPLASFGQGKGLFVKELETALYDGRADFAVHSLKDVPSLLPHGMTLAAILERGSASDLIVSAQAMDGLDGRSLSRPNDLSALPRSWRVGSGSLRRQCQLAHQRPDWQLVAVRGNVGTRLRKLSSGECDALVLARAGLERLSADPKSDISLAELVEQRRVAELTSETMLPCPGQGALCIECLADREDIRQLMVDLHHEPSARCTSAERALGRLFDADCHTPFAAYAHQDGDRVYLEASVPAVSGELVRAHADARSADGVAEELSQGVYQSLCRLGAPKCLRRSGQT